jgi:hypothetical protein
MYQTHDLGQTNGVQEVVLSTDSSILYVHNPNGTLRMIHIKLQPKTDTAEVRGYSTKAKKSNELPDIDSYVENFLTSTLEKSPRADKHGKPVWTVSISQLKKLFRPSRLEHFANPSKYFFVVAKTDGITEKTLDPSKSGAEAYMIAAATGNYAYPPYGILPEYNVIAAGAPAGTRPSPEVRFPDPATMFFGLSSKKLYEQLKNNPVYKPYDVATHVAAMKAQIKLDDELDKQELAGTHNAISGLTVDEFNFLKNLNGKRQVRSFGGAAGAVDAANDETYGAYDPSSQRTAALAALARQGFGKKKKFAVAAPAKTLALYY